MMLAWISGPAMLPFGKRRGEHVVQALRGDADDHDAVAEGGGIDLRLLPSSTCCCE